MIDELNLLLCVASTWFMTGLIWFVQVVHYPLFERVGEDVFRLYHGAHARRTTWVVVFPMIFELVSSGILALRHPAGVDRWLTLAGFLLAVACWGSTALVQVPLHDRLGRGFDREVIQRLVSTNRVRTALWSIHALVTLKILGQLVSQSRIA